MCAYLLSRSPCGSAWLAALCLQQPDAGRALLPGRITGSPRVHGAASRSGRVRLPLALKRRDRNPRVVGRRALRPRERQRWMLLCSICRRR
ncbi:hypothetical protein NDU88_003175 [Pleurodeles waltl]|uniref:Secreted protein n=1 Tax=Pleurodeles waltl TaxID=8319 RepID=A0AAV7UXQ7_PLEWA|nr:hypothetical protein NDU88_003175 [Pleurodeles waltl]